MREFKFRAWHLGSKDFKITPQMLYDTNPGDCLRWKADGQNIGAIMQYTGQKDANGREIFESDIIISDNGIPSVIKWNGNGYDAGMFQFYPEEVEVIGNIYENPELIKK